MPEQPPAPSPNASPEKSPDPATAKDPKTRLKELAAFVANQLSADLLLYSGPMELTGFLRAEKSCRGRKRRKNVLLILSTFGGDASAAYRLARCLQARYTKVIVFVSSMCKSAGTLVCLGAHELILSPEGELGPLDVQLRKPNEVYDYGSGLDPMQALDVLEQRALATFRTALMDIRGRRR